MQTFFEYASMNIVCGGVGGVCLNGKHPFNFRSELDIVVNVILIF